MGLAEVGSLGRVAPEVWAQVGERFREIGFHGGCVQTLPGAAGQFALEWMTLDAEAPALLAVRLLVLRQALEEERVRVVLGEALFREAARGGLLVRDAGGGGWRFPFRLELVNQLYVLCDPVSDEAAAVMTVGGTTQLLARAGYPQQDVESALDVGCGSGVLALLLAGAARRVVGTDINPRAIAMARFNAALNGVENVEFREGDLYEPVAGERFDLILAQPPFYARAGSMADVRYLHGGRLGDEIAMGILAGARTHLRDGGVAVMLADLPVTGTPTGERLRACVREGLMLVVTLDEQVTAATVSTYFGWFGAEAGERATGRAREMYKHMRAMGIEAVEQMVVMVRADGDGCCELRAPRDGWDKLHRVHLDRAAALVRLGDRELAALRLAWGQDCRVVARVDGGGRELWAAAEEAWLGAMAVSEEEWAALAGAVRGERAAAGELVRRALLYGVARVDRQFN
ncbi:MAG: methyltransferase [Bryobacteraceae bacterium]|nr:methyltransferase [Bryobacteraceae bacterium]